MSTLTEFLAVQNAIAARLSPPAAEAYWQLSMTGSDAAKAEHARQKQILLEQYSQSEPFHQARAFLAAGGHDPLTERQLIAIEHKYLTNQFPPELVAEIARLEAELNGIFSSFRGTFRGAPISDNEAVTILQESTDSAERKEAWESTKEVAGAIAPILLELVRLRNDAAQALGYADYWHLQMAAKEIESDWLMALWDRLASLSDSAWDSLKGELDARLAAKYGIGISDLRPWHYEDPHFQKAPQNPAANLDALYAQVDVETVTNATFAHMGQPIDDLLAKSSLYPAENKYQSAFCMDVDRAGDVRVCCNIIPNERWMTTNLHEFGHAAYDKYLDFSLPWLVRCPSHSITTEGVAIFMGNFATDPEWMQAFAGLDPATLHATLPAIRKQKQLEDLIFTRYEQVMVRFEKELYRDPDQDLNTLWWDLVEQYQGLTRPEGRDWPDWASKVHFSIAPCMYQNYLIGFMFITQLATYLRGAVTAGGPLASPAVGAYLKAMIYEPGARLRWDALIAHATGEPLNPEHWIAHITQSDPVLV